MLESAFKPLPQLIRQHAATRPTQPALIDDAETLTYAQLDLLMDRIAATLQSKGLVAGDVIALCSRSSARAAAVFLGALRAGLVVAPLASSVTSASFASMLADAGAKLLFVDDSAGEVLQVHVGSVPHISLDGKLANSTEFDTWLLPSSGAFRDVDIAPMAAFNIIYSSGTTGAPKGIVQSHGMRAAHIVRGARFDYSEGAVTLLATPLYSNTTLVVFLPTLAFGGTVVLMAKFSVDRYLALAVAHRATHTMLVPVQYQRLMDLADFPSRELASFRFKFCTSAPFIAELKATVLARWPGGLVEFYGLTEGGGTCILLAHEHPDKLHTVGQPAEGHDIRLIDEAGRELPRQGPGEVVGHSPGMMTGYHRQPERTAEAEWFDATGKRFIRTGDVGRFDDDGFLILVDRRKDMIISGGYNIYPSDLEALLREHPAVAEAAVIGVPSETWGETPAAWVVLKPGTILTTEDLRGWVNGRVGKTQRLAVLEWIEELPRSAIGKVLKRELREAFIARTLRTQP